MGIAIIILFVYHTNITYSPMLENVKSFGDFGVNLFFALSGFGIYYSYKKRPDAIMFYKNRLLRIGITCLPISVAWCTLVYFLFEPSLQKAICKILAIQFFIDGNLFQWFISGILVLYLITPFWMKLQEKSASFCLTATVLVSVFVTVAPYFGIGDYLLCYMQRIPAYFVGLYFGKASFEKKEGTVFEKTLLMLSAVIAMVLLFIMRFNMLNYRWKYMFELFLTPPALVLLAYLFREEKHTISRRCLNWFGAITLEIYLTHDKWLKILTILLEKLHIAFDSKLIVLNILAIALTAVGAYFYHKMTSGILQRCKRKA